MKQSQESTVLDQARNCYRYLAAGLCFIISLKFCAYISVEQANFPQSFMEWFIFSCWPECLVPAAGAVLLLGAVALYPLPQCRKEACLIPALSALIVLSGLPGLIHTTEWKYASDWMAHFGGSFCLVTAVWYVSFHDRKLLPLILNCLTVSCILSCLKGWFQHFGGLEDNYHMMVENAQATGNPLSGKMIAQLKNTRSYGYFVDPNIYAAQMVLLGPVMVKVMADWSRRFTPRRLSFVLFTGIAVILYAGAVFFSGSRGGVLGMAVGIAVLLWLTPMSRRLKVLVTGCGLVLGLLFLVYVTLSSNRDFSTASIRMQYYLAALKMFAAHPFAGVGLGEFFPWHMRLKSIGFEEARDVHSLFFAQLSQAGIVGGIVGFLRVILPFAMVLGFFRKYRPASHWIFVGAAVSWCGWTAHSLFQFNDMIPAIYSFVPVISLLLTDFDKMTAAAVLPDRKRILIRLGLCVPAVCALLPLMHLEGERNLQTGENLLGKNPAAAGSYLYDAAADLPLSSVPWRLLGECNMRTGEYRESVRCGRELVRRGPHRSSFCCRLARALIMAGQYDEIPELMANARKWYPGNGQVYYLQALGKVAPQLSAGGVFMQKALLADLTALQTRLSLEKDGAVVQLYTGERHDFHISQELIRMLNDCRIEFFDGRPVIFKG